MTRFVRWSITQYHRISDCTSTCIQSRLYPRLYLSALSLIHSRWLSSHVRTIQTTGGCLVPGSGIGSPHFHQIWGSEEQDREPAKPPVVLTRKSCSSSYSQPYRWLSSINCPALPRSHCRSFHKSINQPYQCLIRRDGDSTKWNTSVNLIPTSRAPVTFIMQYR